MYWIGLISFLAVLTLLAFFTGTAVALVDIPSIVVILAISLPILLASGLQKDFFRGFRLMALQTNPFTTIELKRTLTAVKLMETAILLAGVLGSLFGCVVLLATIEDMSMLFPSMAVAMLTLVYSLVLWGLLLPVRYRVEAVLSTLDGRDL